MVVLVVVPFVVVVEEVVFPLVVVVDVVLDALAVVCTNEFSNLQRSFPKRYVRWSGWNQFHRERCEEQWMAGQQCSKWRQWAKPSLQQREKWFRTEQVPGLSEVSRHSK